MKTNTSFRRTSRLIGALMLAIGFGNVAPAHAAANTINNNTFWKDTSGNPIYSQGGGILKVGARYYWYGVKYDAAVDYAKTGKWKDAKARFNAVTAYSSTDLVNWKFEGEVLKATTPGKMFEPDAWFGRLGVVHNQNTRKYVLITQYGSKATGPGVLFATSDTPTGPFVYDNHQRNIDNVGKPGTGDQTVFIDDDGQPYLIFSESDGRRPLYVAPLRPSDFLRVEAATKIYTTPAGGREGNAMFKYKGVYYFCSSELHGWNASRSYFMTANKITGPYSAESVMAGTEADFSHVSQNGFFVPVQGSAATTVLFAGDRWSNFAGNGLGYNVWVPLSFDGATPRFHSLSQFDLDAATGRWSVGKDNNFVLNPSFEADRVPQTSVAGWTSSWTNLTGTAPTMNVADGRTGRWALSLSHPQQTMGGALQNITLPDANYTLKAWVKSGGGQDVAKLYVVGHGGAEMSHPLNTRIEQWTQVTIPHIAVRTGRIQLGVYSEGKERQWLNVDDVSLVKE